MKTPHRSALRPAVLLLALAAWAGCDSGGEGGGGGDPTPTPTGKLSGVVREAGTLTPLPNVSVRLGNAQTTTDGDGRFAFRDVPVGAAVTIQANAGTRFDVYTVQVAVQAGDNVHDVSLARRTYYTHNSEQGNFGVYLPVGVATYRGAIFYVAPGTIDARGFASGGRVTFNPRDPEREVSANAYFSEVRRRALVLAQEHGLALIGVERLTPGQTLDGALTALEQIAGQSGHPELAQAPLLLSGFSEGGSIAYDFTHRKSDRVIGFVTQKGGGHTLGDLGPASRVPGYLFIGMSDEPQRAENITRLFEVNRAGGAPWALAVEPGGGHTAIADFDLLFRWFDAVLEARLPATVTPGSPVVLNALDEASGWLGDRASFSIAAYASYDGDRRQASWLPSMQTAQDWRRFAENQ